MLYLGIVGHEAAKFTPEGEAQARTIIDLLLTSNVLHPITVVSGHCPLGGIDIWAEEEAARLGVPRLIYPPRTNSWSSGYKPRNIQIAARSDIVHNIVVDRLPDTYRGMRFTSCYHCDTTTHVKSGGCWTAKHAQKLGKAAKWHIVNQSTDLPQGAQSS